MRAMNSFFTDEFNMFEMTDIERKNQNENCMQWRCFAIAINFFILDFYATKRDQKRYSSDITEIITWNTF